MKLRTLVGLLALTMLGLAVAAQAEGQNLLSDEEQNAGWRLGEWNQTRILAQGKHVEHWLNGEKLLDYDIDSDRWKAHLKTSKFFLTAYGQGNWGRAVKGHIGLQDYGGAIEYRNIKIRPMQVAVK